MSVATFDLTGDHAIPQGGKYQKTFGFEEKDANGDWQTKDLTGFDARIQIRHSPGGTLIYTADTDDASPDLVVNAGDGEVVWTIPSSVTALFKFRDRAVWELEIDDGADSKDPSKILQGDVELRLGIVTAASS